jgi:hypothetical protein
MNAVTPRYLEAAGISIVLVGLSSIPMLFRHLQIGSIRHPVPARMYLVRQESQW